MATTLKRASGPRSRTWLRPLAVIAASAGAVVAWTLITQVGHIDLRSPALQGSGPTSFIWLGSVVAIGGLASLLAWAVLAVLEHRVRKVKRAWLVAASLAFLISLGGPLSGTGISGADRGYLVVLHVVVATVLTSMLYASIEAGT